MERLGGGLLAVSVDPPATNAKVRADRRLPFPIASDETREAVRAFGVLHERAGPGASDIALPSMFLIERGGHIVWSHVAARIVDRPDPTDVLERVRGLAVH